MFEKSILVVYLNIDDLPISEAINSTQSTIHYLDEQFKDEPDLKCLVAPVRNQPTKIELLNAKYPDWETFQKDIDNLYQQVIDVTTK